MKHVKNDNIQAKGVIFSFILKMVLLNWLLRNGPGKNPGPTSSPSLSDNKKVKLIIIYGEIQVPMDTVYSISINLKEMLLDSVSQCPIRAA